MSEKITDSVASMPEPADSFGFIGLGNMGIPMVLRLLELGQPVRVWSRNPDSCRAVVTAGAIALASPREVAEHSAIVGLCLSDGAAVEEVTFGEQGLLCPSDSPRAIRLIIDFSTIDPKEARQFSARAEQQGCDWVDAPVSGGVPAAVQGTLICFVGGPSAAIERAQSFLRSVTSRVTHMGSIGAGLVTKICNQMIVAVNMLTIAEAVNFGAQQGIDVHRLAPALAGGFADSTPLQIFGPKMASRNFEPRQTAARLMAKDLGIAKSLAAENAIQVPVVQFAEQLYRNAFQRDPALSEADVSALIGLFSEG